ncbi:NAD(P)/FAD-dependent oxidoreductase [Allorhizocola rhizosphaerae]|uniref:NAD(P)/FAD-dependent oxidoreductase n=1 Tax=Allorhizocola rhizosphaerae TaxID=1872709 RepID=UPI000E3D820A|nr:FAD-dependent oxidoreductase [Allorhizocola rhizosphaerae]
MAGGRIVVVGGGQAGFQACSSLRDNGFDGDLSLVCEERTLPYERPPLSKDYLRGDIDLALRPESFYDGKGIDLIAGRVAGIDPRARTATLDSGRSLPYDRLILATGARARTLPVPGARLSNVFTLRTVGDAESLRKRLEAGTRVVVVGGGFIGLEVASLAQELGCDTTVVEVLPHAMARVVTPQTSDTLVEVHRSRGTRVLLGRRVAAFDGDHAGRVRQVALDNGTRLEADVVVLGVGVVPNVELAYKANLPTSDGFLVDQTLRTSDPAIYAIGDCARFPSRHASSLIRLESVQNAVDQAHHVARCITGQPEPYTAVPWFWSDQCGLKLQISGISLGHDQTVLKGDPAEGRFSVFCFRSGELVAVESVNRPADHIISRRLLAGTTELTPDDVAHPDFDLKKAPR